MFKLPKFKKIILLLVIFGLVLSVLPPIARARYFPGSNLERYNALEDYKQTLEQEDMNLSQWILYTVKYITFGGTRILMEAPLLSGEERAHSGGAAGLFAGFIAGMYANRPISSQKYLAYLGKNLEIVKPAYAQGKGWTFLEPVLPLWKVTRNITYLAFVLIFVVMGFMVMFRKKMDPQTAISIQTALPKVIIALLLVTFSYALCGLLVDFIYVGNELMSKVFETALVDIGRKTSPASYTGWITMFYPITYASALGNITNILKAITEGIKMLFQIAGAVAGDFTGVFNLIIAFVFVSSIIKIFFALLSRYVMIIMYAIFSPLAFAWGSLPGQEDHISRFFKSLLSAVISFPAVLLLLNIAAAISSAGQNLGMVELPPFTTEFIDPSTGAATTSPVLSGMAAFISLGIIMATAKIPETIDDALAIKPGAGLALGAEAMGAARKIPIVGSLIG